MTGLIISFLKYKNKNMEELKRIEVYVNKSLDIVINTNNRKQDIVDGRFLFSALARKCTELSLSKIGKYLNKDHATIIHGITQFNNVLVLDEKFKGLYDTYVFNYLVRKVEEQGEQEELNKQDSIELTELREIRVKEFNGLKAKINLLERQKDILENDNITLKLKVKNEEPFLKDYYDLEINEQKIVEERLKVIIRMLPSNQKRKEVFEIINCSA